MSDRRFAEECPYSKYEPIFGCWYITRQIGKGAIGRVYEIEREDLGETYKAALKIISIPTDEEDITNVLGSGIAREDLEEYYSNLMKNVVNEYQFLAKLKGNSHVVNYEDHCIIKKEDILGWDILIKTELLTPLINHAIEHPLDESDVLKLGMDICRALVYCGQFGIIHRDIKPENIFIAPSGDYKIGDFGIARLVEETQMSLSRKGTYSYMSPEIFHGKAYGQSADVYSLGLVMYKYLNHSRIPFMPPYPEKIVYDDKEEAFSRRMSGEEIPAPDVGSEALKEVVLKACEFDLAERYKSASEMLEDLEAIQFGRSFKKVKARKKKPATRRFARIASVAAGAILTCVLGIYLIIPKEVTEIQGIDSSVSLFYDASLAPEYTIEPKWLEDEPIRFSSTDKRVFTVTDKGEINAVAIGEADMKMTAKEYTETVHVVVVPKVTDIKGINEAYILYRGNSVDLEPKLEPERFAGETISFSSDNEGVATVSDEGLITAVGAGNALITISAGGSSCECEITVSDPPPIYYTSSSKKKTPSKKTSSKKAKSSGNPDGFFEDKDDEYFD